METTQTRRKLERAEPVPRVLTASCVICGKLRPRETLRSLTDSCGACVDCLAQWEVHGNTG